MKTTFTTSVSATDVHTTKIDKYIEVVRSTNPRLNTMSKGSRLSIVQTLSQHYTKVGITVVDSMDDLRRLVAKQPDLVVLGMKRVPTGAAKASGRMWLTTYLEANGIAYTGSDADALALEYDKHQAKQRALDSGLRTSAFFVSNAATPTYDHSLQYPLFVKPTSQGGGKGIDEFSVVYSDSDLTAKIQSIHNGSGADVLVEEYLPGREFSVAVMRHAATKQLVAMPIEIVTPIDKQGNSFLSAAIKAADQERVSRVEDQQLVGLLNNLAIDVFKALGSRDYGRIDMRLDGQGRPSFMEANLMPGLSNHGYLARCFYLNKQISYADMILGIVELGLVRNIGATYAAQSA